MLYPISDTELSRMKRAIQTALAIPFIDDVEDFVWERIFAYAREITIKDPLTHIRKKSLFDIVDSRRAIGWSAKALQWRNGALVTVANLN